MSYTQWSEAGDGNFTPVGKTSAELTPGYYDTITVQGQIFFVPVRPRGDDLLKFPDSASLSVLSGIADFWDREERFARYGLPFKRGILLYGPPGSGKTCTLQLVSRDVVARGGVVVTFNPYVFLSAYRAFRDIQPETPMVVLLEDFESLMTPSTESMLLNLLDGVESLHKVVFLATTNYPERLEDRIVNRPSRFDIRIKVDRPDETARRLYLESLLYPDDEIDVDAFVADTAGLSLAHVKELFVAVHVLGNDYAESVKRINSMQSEKATSADDIPSSRWPGVKGKSDKPALGNYI